MPELPEVETIKRGLKATIINKQIIRVQVKTPVLIRMPKLDEFVNKIKGNLYHKMTFHTVRVIKIKKIWINITKLPT